MEDSEAEVRTKLKKAFCPSGVVAGNPVLAYVDMIVLPWCGSITVARRVDGDGNVDGGPPTEGAGKKPATAPREYTTMADLEADFASGAVHPGDLKPAVAEAINGILQPVRDHFVNDPRAAALLKKVKTFKVTK